MNNDNDITHKNSNLNKLISHSLIVIISSVDFVLELNFSSWSCVINRRNLNDSINYPIDYDLYDGMGILKHKLNIKT